MPTMFNVDFQASSVFSNDSAKVNEKIKAEREKQDAATACRLEFIGSPVVPFSHFVGLRV